MTNAEHHLHKRRLIHKNLEHYPHPEKRKYVIDGLVFFIGGIGPIFSIPQLLKIWDEKKYEWTFDNYIGGIFRFFMYMARVWNHL